MDDLLMGAFHGAAADPIAQSQIFVITHAPSVLAVVVDEPLQTLAQFRCFRLQTLQSGDDLLHLSGPQILGDLMHPTVGLCRTFPIAEMSESPSVFQSVPEIEDFTTARKHAGAIPDPFRTIADNDYHRVGANPTQLPQLRIQSSKDGVSIPQASHQKPAHHRAPPWRGFHSLVRQ